MRGRIAIAIAIGALFGARPVYAGEPPSGNEPEPDLELLPPPAEPDLVAPPSVVGTPEPTPWLLLAGVVACATGVVLGGIATYVYVRGLRESRAIEPENYTRAEAEAALARANRKADAARWFGIGGGVAALSGGALLAVDHWLLRPALVPHQHGAVLSLRVGF